MRLTARFAIRTSALAAAAFLISARASFAAPAGPCSLATSGEIGTVLGTTFDAGKALNARTCQWREQVKPGATDFIVDVNTNSISFYNTMKTVPGTATHKPVSGVGDEAFFTLFKADNQVNESLWVKKGDSAFNVRIWGSKSLSDADREMKEEAIASAVVKTM